MIYCEECGKPLYGYGAKPVLEFVLCSRCKAAIAGTIPSEIGVPEPQVPASPAAVAGKEQEA